MPSVKPNYFYHPLIKLLCLLLCIAAAATCCYSFLRVLFMDNLGTMDDDPQFNPYIKTHSPTTELYWPQYYAWDTMAIEPDESRYYYTSDILSNLVQNEIISGTQFRQLLSPETLSVPSMFETTVTDNAVYPNPVSDDIRVFLEAHASDRVNFRFRITLNHPNLDSKTILANVGDDIDLDATLNARTSSVYTTDLGNSGYTLTFHFGLVQAFAVPDSYAICYNAWANDVAQWEVYLLSGAIAAVVSLVCLVLVLLQSGMRYRTPGLVYLNRFDRLPFEITAAVKGTAGIGLLALLVVCADIIPDSNRFLRLLFAYEAGDLRDWLQPICIIALASLVFLVGLSFLCEGVRRFRGGKWWQYTLVYRFFRCLVRLLRKCGSIVTAIFGNLPLLWRWLVGCALFGLWTLLAMMTDTLIVLWFFSALALGIGGCFYLLQLDRACRGAEKIAGGDIGHKIDTSKMFGTPKTLSEHLNSMGNATQRAVEERMKSERFRSELITNVSHDLKTPLTSIINYTDLLSKEPCDNETAKEYIAVLTRQSTRLKKLTDDLLDASKASSGTLPVTLTPTDAAELLTQAAGEYEERFRAAGLTPVTEIREQPLMISADGRHLWRVFDNLLSNICKYSMPGTRVYLHAYAEHGNVFLVFRNISAEPIAVTPDELTERFVRGDASRHTEGSGLGLAIADSLAALQGGKLTLCTDGDLFKATVAFKALTP